MMFLARWREGCSPRVADLALLWECRTTADEDKHATILLFSLVLTVQCVASQLCLNFGACIIDTNLTISRGITDSQSPPGGMCVCDWMWKERQSGWLSVKLNFWSNYDVGIMRTGIVGVLCLSVLCLIAFPSKRLKRRYKMHELSCLYLRA